MYPIDECHAIVETSDSLLIEGPLLPNGQIWIQKSHINMYSQVNTLGDKGKLIVDEQGANECGII